MGYVRVLEGKSEIGDMYFRFKESIKKKKLGKRVYLIDKC